MTETPATGTVVVPARLRQSRVRVDETPMIDRYRWWEMVLIYLGIAVFLTFILSPFVEGFLVSLKPLSQLFSSPYRFFPENGSFEAYRTMWISVPGFARYIFNSFFISIVVTVIVLCLVVPASYAFAKFEFPGKNILFAFLIGTMILPPASSLVALFVIMTDLHLIGSYLPEILPHLVPAFGVFWMRQYATSSIPNELIDAARIDGCSHFRLYWNVALPALRPALGFLGITTFIFAWNDYLWPLIVFNTPNLYTLQVSLAQLNGVYYTDYSMVMAGTFMATIPLFIIFFLGARQFIANLSAGAIKF